MLNVDLKLNLLILFYFLNSIPNRYSLRNTQPMTLFKGLSLGDWGNFIGRGKSWEYLGVYVHISLLWSALPND